MCTRGAGLFFYHLTQLAEARDDPAVILAAVRHEAAGAVLDAALCKAAIAAALFAQRVQRTVAEQAVEIFGVSALVAREKFALPILKKGVVLALPIFRHFLHLTRSFSVRAGSGVTNSVR